MTRCKGRSLSATTKQLTKRDYTNIYAYSETRSTRRSAARQDAESADTAVFEVRCDGPQLGNSDDNTASKLKSSDGDPAFKLKTAVIKDNRRTLQKTRNRRGEVVEEDAEQPGLVVKILRTDWKPNPVTVRRLVQEAQLYDQLKDLQGHIIPACAGLWKGTGCLILILEQCEGRPIGAEPRDSVTR